MNYKLSWKEKIDPAFDQIMKFYVEFLDFVGLTSNEGWIGLEDDVLEHWEKKGMKGWIKNYEKDMSTEKRTIIKWKIPKVVSKEEAEKARYDFKKWLLKKIKRLPEDSQNYYKKVFLPFYSEIDAVHHFKNKSLETLKKISTDFWGDLFLLSLHDRIVEIQNQFRNSAKEALEKDLYRHSFYLDITLAIYNSIALLVFEKTLTDLLKEAKNGDKGSFFNLVQIDRTVIECDWAQKIIRKAQLAGDEQFFKQMAKAISRTPLENDKEYTTARIVILIFWQLGLRKLDYIEMLELIESCGVKLQETPEAFERFVRRLIKGTLRRDIITFHKVTKATS